MIREQCTEIGTIARPHGIKGELLVRFHTVPAEDKLSKEPLFILVQGTLVPFFIEHYRFNEDHAFIKFEFIDSEAEAKKFTGMSVYSFPGKSSEEISVEGYEMLDETSGTHATIKRFIENPVNPLFLLQTSKGEVLVPAHPDLILQTDHKNRKIIMRLPFGLF